jgi:hypothetical protein
MPSTRVALISVWFIVLGLFLLTASGSIAAKTGLIWVVIAGLLAPGLVLTLTDRLRKAPVVVVPAGAGLLVTPDRPGETRGDSARG